MSHPCSEFREWIVDAHMEGLDVHAASPATHLAKCEDCRRFAARQERWVAALGSLERIEPPLEFEARVAHALSPEGQVELVTNLFLGLPEVSAPRELDERMERLLDGSEPLSARLLRTLERPSAPLVLDRLVDEELADPAALSRRLVRELGRPEPPAQLALAVHRNLTSERSGPRRRGVTLAALGLAAAAFLIWALPARFGGSGAQGFELEIVEASSLGDFSPFARSILDGLSGGATDGAVR